MKNKSNTEKKKNIFKFKKFSERISEIDIRKSALYHIKHENEDNDEVESEKSTNFHECLQKWMSLNLTEEFDKFQKGIYRIITLPQLIHKKDYVIEHLLKHLESSTKLSLEPLLEFIVALAKDLQDDFYQYFPKFLDRLIENLNTKDPDELEWTLVCLAFLFKTLKSFIKKDIYNVLIIVLPLLDEGKPVHITNFAAECISFVSRDIRDKQKFLDIVMEITFDNRNCSIGVGRLLFEIIRGVNGKFHSCAESVLMNIFKNFSNLKFNRDLYFEICNQTVTDILECISIDEIHVFWKCILKCLEEFEAAFKTEDLDSEKSIEYLLKLIGQVVECKSGIFVQDPLDLVNHLLKILDFDGTEEFAVVTSNLCSVILLGENIKLSQLESSRICRKILTTSYHEVFESFVWNTVDYTQFDLLILPEFLKYFNLHFNENCMNLITKILLKKSKLCRNGIDLEGWKEFPIFLKNSNNCLEKIEHYILDKQSFNDIVEDSEKILLALIFYNHIQNVDKVKISGKVLELLEEGLQQVELEDEPVGGKEVEEFILNKKIFFVLSFLIESAIHLGLEIDRKRCLDILLPYCTDFRYIHVLGMVDMIITSNKSAIEFDFIHEKLLKSLASPYHEVRMNILHIFKQFNEIYETVFEAEMIKTTIFNYREKLQIFDKFTWDSNYYQTTMANQENIKFDMIYYLTGCMYENFKLLWEPISKVILSYSENIPANDFWLIFKWCFEYCEENIELIYSDDSESLDDDSVKNQLLNNVFSEFWNLNEKPDFINCRILFLGILAKARQLCEIKNHDIVEKFLKFIDIDITPNIEESVMVDLTIDTNETEKLKKRPQIAVQPTLQAYLKIFTKMENPKSLYQESKLREFYYYCLGHKNFEVQKLALECLVAYKFKYLTPYKDHLFNLINEKEFKNEITSFKIDSESKQIADEHREMFLPILMKILISRMGMKMLTKKDSANTRKSIILRFISQCDKSEIFQFIKLFFRDYSDFFDFTNLNELITSLKENLNVKSTFHPKKLQSSINLIDIMRESIGGQLNNEFIRYLMFLVVGMCTIVQECLARDICNNHLNAIKSVKNDCYTIILNIFEQYEKYQWNANEIDSLFETFIWPGLDKLPLDSIHKPTPLLKILLEFGKNPRYHILLSKSNETKAPIPVLIELLLGNKSSGTVQTSIMEMIEHLLTLDYTLIQLEDQLPIEINNSLLPVQKSTKLSIGCQLLLPHFSTILNKFQSSLSKASKNNNLNRRDIMILSRITDLVKDSKTSGKLLPLILPILIKKANLSSTDEDVMFEMVTTLTNLIKQIENPELYIRNIAPLFEQVNTIGTRKLLCQLITEIAQHKNDPKLIQLAEITNELNALDRRWIDQPDYERRLDCIKKIRDLNEANEIDINLCLIVIYHSFYFLKHDKDLAIRDSSSFLLKAVVPNVTKNYFEINKKEVDFLIGDIVLNIVRKTLSDKNNIYRNEGISLLGELTRECFKCHPVLRDLHPLTDKNDPEIDFFENLIHLQTHRHGRALLRFCTISKTYNHLPNPRTLTQFIMPITSIYLFNEDYIKNHSLIEAAISAVGAACQLLPWAQYEMVLRYHLKQLRRNADHQKQLVRLVISILDSFHFDLSKATVATSNLPRLQDIEDESILKKLKRNDDDSMINLDFNETIEETAESVTPSKTPKKDKSIIVLSQSAANRLIETISGDILPALNNAIVKLTSFDKNHKVMRKKKLSEKEEEDKLRVPIALAIVKLLQKLPEGMLDHNLPGIFMKITTFLKSHLKSIRMLARDILRKIMLCVGPSRLEILLKHLSALLTRGFQVHVLSVTVHNVLEGLKSEFKKGDIDRNLNSVMKVALEDIFGRTSEEKEVQQLTNATPEAKPSNKSYMILNILAKNITESCLLDLIVPLKKQLAKSQSRKTVNKVQEAFQKIMLGLIENENISVESLFIFIYGITSESITDLVLNPLQSQLTQTEREKLKRARPDIFIIPEEPRSRSGEVKRIIKTNNQANAHILIEFGLDVLHSILKRGKHNQFDYIPYLDPIILILQKSLISQHIKVSTYALKCFASIWNQKLELPNLKAQINEIVDEIFKILHKYSTIGMTTNDSNYHLVKNIFKGLMSLLRFVEYYAITEEHLKILLEYVAQDLNSAEKQSFAFSLLKSILAKKLKVPELNQLMGEVAKISILSESANVREETRSIVISYLMNYPLGKQINGHLAFYAHQLKYEVVTGRQSAIKTINAVIKKFPVKVLQINSRMLFLALVTALATEEEIDLRILIAETIEELLAKVEKSHLDELFEITCTLLLDSKLEHREMAAQMCIRFVNVEKDKFTTRLTEIFPILLNALTFNDDSNGGKFVKITNSFINDDDTEDTIRAKDHVIIQIQNALMKILDACPKLYKKSIFYDKIDELAYESQKLLNYDHSWVRLNSLKILESIISSIDFKIIDNLFLNNGVTSDDDDNDEKAKRYFIYKNPEIDIKSLIIDHCSLMFPGDTTEEMAEQVMKNLMFLANFIKSIPFKKSEEKNHDDDKSDDDDDDDDNETNNKKSFSINLIWLIRRIRFIINSEVSTTPMITTLRSAVFNWISGIITLLSADQIKELAHLLMPPLVREMSEEDKTVDPKLRQKANKIGNKLKQKIGELEFNLLRTKIQQKLMMKRANRKKILAQEKINNPEIASKRKINIQQKKKDAKRRKLEIIRGKGTGNRKRKIKDDLDF